MLCLSYVLGLQATLFKANVTPPGPELPGAPTPEPRGGQHCQGPWQGHVSLAKDRFLFFLLCPHKHRLAWDSHAKCPSVIFH